MDLIPNIPGILFGFALSFFGLWALNRLKTRNDNKTMRRNMAELLHNELVTNATEIDRYNQRGFHEGPPIADNVYNGLLSSGNMRYLMDHQNSLYLLYVSMRRNDPDVAIDIRKKAENLEQIFT